jgi:hypothetical protein
MPQELQKLTEFIKAQTERRSRQAATKSAVQQARKIAQEKGQFKPKPLAPAKTVKLSF